MTRRTIDIPDTFHFETDYRVVYSDINAANHLAADRILPIALEAQFRFIKIEVTATPLCLKTPD